MDPIALLTKRAEVDRAPLGKEELPRPGLFRGREKPAFSGRTAEMGRLGCHRGARRLPRRAVAISSLETQAESW